MKHKPEQYYKRKNKIWANNDTYPLTEEECLCWNCGIRFKKCQWSVLFSNISRLSNVDMMITRCPNWEKGE